MKDPVRITIDFKTNTYTFEYGVQREPGLTPLEAHEVDELSKELKDKNFSDFSKAELLKDSERDVLMKKKRRLEELREMENEGRFEYVSVKDLPRTLFVLIRPDQPIDCVSNMPDWMLTKLFERVAIINQYAEGQVAHAEFTPPPGPIEGAKVEYRSAENLNTPSQKQVNPLQSGTPNELKVRAFLLTITGPWFPIPGADTPKNALDAVSIEELEGVVHVRPAKFLKDNWKTINEAIKKEWGDKTWKSEGKGDRDAHWVINFR